MRDSQPQTPHPLILSTVPAPAGSPSQLSKQQKQCKQRPGRALASRESLGPSRRRQVGLRGQRDLLGRPVPQPGSQLGVARLPAWLDGGAVGVVVVQALPGGRATKECVSFSSMCLAFCAMELVSGERFAGSVAQASNHIPAAPSLSAPVALPCHPAKQIGTLHLSKS